MLSALHIMYFQCYRASGLRSPPWSTTRCLDMLPATCLVTDARPRRK